MPILIVILIVCNGVIGYRRAGSFHGVNIRYFRGKADFHDTKT